MNCDWLIISTWRKQKPGGKRIKWMQKTMGHLNAPVLVIHSFIQHLLQWCWINFPLHSSILICQLIHENFLELLIKKRIFLHSLLPSSELFLALPHMLSIDFLACYVLPETRSFTCIAHCCISKGLNNVYARSSVYICIMAD